MEDKRRKRRRRRRRRKRGYNKRNMILLGMVILAAIILVAGIEMFLSRAVKKHDDGTILQGVSIGNSDVSGMTKKEAVKVIEAEIEKYSAETFTFELETGDKLEASLSELGFEAEDLEAAVDEAEKYGKSGNAVSSYKIILESEKGELDHQVPLKLQVSEEKLNAVLQEKSKDLLSVPVNAAVTQQDGKVVIVEEKKGETPDSEEAFEKLTEIINKGWDGAGKTIKLSVKKSKPEITAEDLAEVTDLLGSHSTYYGADGSGRSQNVESGAMHIGGTLMQPGDEVSANALMEPYTYENGYAEAASYESNTVVQTMGGGICQVSTTLYNALLFAELEIVERYPHSMLVSYAEPSKDAAIADDVLDLVFKNNLDAPVYIESVLSGGNVTFNVYGKETRSPGRTIEFISETTESKETEGKRFVATEDYIGYCEKQSDSHPEITAQLWKVVYEDGVEVSRDVINYSSYVAAPETYGVGTASDDAAAVEKIKNAILTQDEKTIQDTINEILNPSPESGTDSGTEQDSNAGQ